MNVADMKVAYDFNGKVMKLVRYDIDRLPDNSKPVDVV